MIGNQRVDQRVVIGIDVGGTLVKSGLVSPNGDVLEFRSEPTRKQSGASVGAQLVEILRRLSNVPAVGTVVGAGIGIAGNVDAATKIILHSPNLKATEGLDILAAVSGRTDLPVAVDNDGNAGALGEYMFGAGRGARSLVYLCIGTGVGGGLVLDGKLYRGSKGYAGELGHTNVVPDGRKCLCGGIGCLETEVSSVALVRRAREAVARGVKSLLEKEEDITAARIGQGADRGDALCTAILEDAGKKLGIAMANFINIFNPDAIILGGGVSASGHHLLGPAVNEASKRAFPSPFRACRFAVTELLNTSGVAGAAALALERP